MFSMNQMLPMTSRPFQAAQVSLLQNTLCLLNQPEPYENKSETLIPYSQIVCVSYDLQTFIITVLHSRPDTRINIHDATGDIYNAIKAKLNS